MQFSIRSKEKVMSNQPKTPSHYCYHVRDGKEKGKGFWTRIGAAWQHQDGKGFNLQLEVVPLDGRVQLRVATENKQ
jgi:hypothetical protein